VDLIAGKPPAMPARSAERLLVRCGGAATKLTELNGARLSGFRELTAHLS
jgi:hypothetical protein